MFLALEIDRFFFYYSLHLCRILSENKSHDSSTYRGMIFQNYLSYHFCLLNVINYLMLCVKTKVLTVHA